MADLPTDFWSGWIAVITLTSLVGLGWLVFSVYFSPDLEHGDAEETVWDSNLREGSNPAPMWWFWFILAFMVFSVIYLMLYPGLGSYQGALKWSQGGEIEQSIARYEAEFAGMRSLVAEGNVATLRRDPAIMASAQRVFDRNCAVCHGYDAAGQADLFPDLVDGVWQWGGSEQQIEQTLLAGRSAVMVGWQQVLGDEGVEQMVDFMSVIGSDAAAGHPGQARYNQFCIACHGPTGAGNPALGAPNLADDVWLYGNSREALTHSIAVGRNGIMPAFGERLDETQIRLLVALLSQE